MEEVLLLILKTYGIVGVIILLPYAGMVYLWRYIQRQHKNALEQAERYSKFADEAGNRVSVVQEKRISDAQGLSNKLMDLMTERSSLDKETNLALDRIGDMVSMVVNSGGHHVSKRS